jgi:hypothetical protein
MQMTTSIHPNEDPMDVASVVLPVERPVIDTEYEVCNLAELIEVCQAIHNECNPFFRSNVDPSEIYVQSKQFNRVWLTLSTETLTDGSRVYNVNIR